MLTKIRSIILLQGVFDKKFFDFVHRKQFKNVFILEGRPGLEAAQVASREFLKRALKPTLITDNMAGFLFSKNLVKEVWLACQLADRKGAICQIGALILAVLGKKHKVPVYLFPVDFKSKLMGQKKDLLFLGGKRIALDEVNTYVPLVEWVPKKYITRVYSSGKK